MCPREAILCHSWWRHQMETFSALLAVCAGNSPVTGSFPHKGQWRGVLMFSSICAWINAWVNNREAGGHLIVRSCKFSKPRILYSELCDYSEIWLESRQYCCPDAYRTPNRHDDLNYQSHGFETSRNVRWCIGYWNWPLAPFPNTNQL